jgi:hypothetical protein
METNQTEHIKIRQVAKDYEKRGYKVIIEPRGADIPSFIKNYQPDLIAKSEKENVVIEIKTRSDFLTIEKLRDIADIINKKGGWRFELIITNPKQQKEIEEHRINQDFSITEIENNLNEINSLIKQNLLSAAFILCWANLESLSRQLLFEDKKDLTNKAPLVLVKTLFSFGYLSRRDYETLEGLLQTRNQIVHGFKPASLDKNSARKLLNITERLLTEKR